MTPSGVDGVMTPSRAAKALIDRYFGVLATVGGLLIVGGFVAVKYLV